MRAGKNHEAPMLFLGDIILLYLSLWLTLEVREIFNPSSLSFSDHAVPFSIIFVIWLLAFFVFGLYEKHTLIFRKSLPTTVISTQFFNVILAVLFFYLIPYFGLAPKTNLFIYLAISTSLLLFWRLRLFPKLLGRRRRQKAVIIGHSREVTELVEEVNNNPRYHFEFVFTADIDADFLPAEFGSEIKSAVSDGSISVIVADIHSKKMEEILPSLYQLSFLESKMSFLDIHQVYEEIFDRVPLSVLRESWILENLSPGQSKWYDFVKRIMDIIIGSLMAVLMLILWPLVALALRLEGPGPVLLRQNRAGRGGQTIIVHKFRTMERHEEGVWLGESDNRVTPIGAFLRKTNIDELPQAIDIILGRLSLIGPRSDIVELRNRLSSIIAFYNVRYIVSPGLSGWAQIKQSYNFGNISPQTKEENLVRLAYDLYYLKNRSLFLDVKIALQTIKILLLRLFL